MKWRRARGHFAETARESIFDAILNRAPVPPVRLNPDVPAELERIIDKCLEKDRNLRYQHASDIRTDLQRLKRDTDSGRVTTSADAGSRDAASPNAGRSMVPAAAVLLVASGRGLLLSSPHASDSRTRTRLSSPISPTRPATRCLTARFARGWRYSWNNRRSSASSPTSGSRRRCSLMGQPADARLTPELAKEICERTASAAVLEGSIASLGSQYVLGLRAKNCRTGDVLDEEQVQAARKEDVLNALSQIASKIQNPSRRIARHGREARYAARRGDHAVARSLESLQRGLEACSTRSTDLAAAVPLFKRAIEIDPNSRWRMRRWGSSTAFMGELPLSAESNAQSL